MNVSDERMIEQLYTELLRIEQIADKLRDELNVGYAKLDAAGIAFADDDGVWLPIADRIERLCAKLAQAQAELSRLRISLVTACVERDILNASELCSETMAELAQAREELAAVDEALGEFYAPVLDPETDEPCGSFWEDHGVNVMRQALDDARADLADARRDAQDALARECNQSKADWEDRLAQLKYAEDALAHCGLGGIEAEFTGVADAIQQMAAYIEERDAECEDAITKVVEARRVARLWYRRAQEQPVEIEITGAEMIEALRAERQLRREAEQRAETAEAQLRLGHEALDATGIAREDDYGVLSIVGRVVKLRQRTEHAEALAQLVTEETAALLERLVDFIAYAHTSDGYDYEHWFEEPFKDDPNQARTLAAHIREALETENGKVP